MGRLLRILTAITLCTAFWSDGAFSEDSQDQLEGYVPIEDVGVLRFTLENHQPECVDQYDLNRANINCSVLVSLYGVYRWNCTDFKHGMPKGTAAVRCTDWKENANHQWLVRPDSCRIECREDRLYLPDTPRLNFSQSSHVALPDGEVSQIHCEGDIAAANCPTALYCSNVVVGQGRRSQWVCNGTLHNSQIRNVQPEVHCIGYDYPRDPFVFEGSCRALIRWNRTAEDDDGTGNSVLKSALWIGIPVAVIVIVVIIVFGVIFTKRRRALVQTAHAPVPQEDPDVGTHLEPVEVDE